MVLDRHTIMISFPFPEPDFKLHRGCSTHPVSWGCLAILQDVTKTGQEDLDRELLDHWLRDPGNNTATDTCTGFKSLTAAVVSVLWKQA